MTLLDHFRNHLVARGIVRMPKATGSSLPPLFLEPRVGTPAPGDGKVPEAHPSMVLGAVRATPIAVAAYESWFWRPVVDLQVRLQDARDLDGIEGSLLGEFEDRRAWTTATGLYVIESAVWRPMQRLGSDERSFTFQTSYTFQLYSGRAPRDGI